MTYCAVLSLQVEFIVDPAEFEADESRQLVRYLHTRTLQVDVWDGDSLLCLGTASIPLMVNTLSYSSKPWLHVCY